MRASSGGCRFLPKGLGGPAATNCSVNVRSGGEFSAARSQAPGDSCGLAALLDGLVAALLVDDDLSLRLLVVGQGQEAGRMLAHLGVLLKRDEHDLRAFRICTLAEEGQARFFVPLALEDLAQLLVCVPEDGLVLGNALGATHGSHAGLVSQIGAA